MVLGYGLNFLVWHNLFPLDVHYFGEQFTSARIVGLLLWVRMLFHYQNTSLCTSEQACLRAEEKNHRKLSFFSIRSMRLGDLHMILRNELKVFISCLFVYVAGIVHLDKATS